MDSSGGSKEIYTTDPHEPRTQLVLRDRRGFIRLALRHGAPLVPVFVFGEKYAYHRFKHRTGFAYFVLRTLRVPFLIFWGR
jgi:1-acyl-sn-glycerol-3-phosphate acyltransferase